MKIVKYFLVLITIVLMIANVYSFEASDALEEVPNVKFPTRYIRFQGDNMGHKPWDHFVSYTPKANFNAAVFDKLLNITSDYQLKPGLIKSWKWNSKEKSYSFKIDTTAKFDANRNLKPIDIEFTILKHFISKVDETDKRIFYDIVGVENLKKGAPFVSGMCRGIKTISNDELKVFLKEINPNFLYSLGDLVSPVAPVEDFEDNLFSFKGLPRGTGKYKVVWSSKKNSLVRLEFKNIDVAKTEGKFPLEIDFYNHGNLVENKVDVASGFDARSLVDNPNYTVEKGPVPIGISVIDFNYSTSLGANQNFRKAVSLAINRDKLFEDSPFLNTYHEMIPNSYYGRSGLKYEFNPIKAKKIIKKYFANISSPGRPIKGIFHGDPTKPKRPKIKEVEEQLAAVGLYVDLHGADKVFFVEEFKDAVLSTYGAIVSFADPLMSFAHYLPGTSAPENTDLKDKKSIKLFEKIKAARTKDERHLLLKELSIHFHNQYRQIPLSEILQAYAYSSRIKKLNLGKSIMVVDFSKIEMK